VADRILAQLTGAIRLKLPSGVADYLPEETTGHTEELWTMAD
jgi:hypothetical protein